MSQPREGRNRTAALAADLAVRTAATSPAHAATTRTTPARPTPLRRLLDYEAAVLFNAYAGKLWRRFTTYLPRHLARLAGLTQQQLRALARVRYVKVAEYQERGVVHFHAVIRLDAPGEDHQPPAERFTADLLADAIRDAAAAVRLVQGPDEDHPHRCRTPRATLLRRDYNRRIWKPAIAAAGLPGDATFHELRHTFASTALAEGVPISEVSRWLGHKPITSTVDVYGHLVPEASARARDALDNAFRLARMCPQRAPASS